MIQKVTSQNSLVTVNASSSAPDVTRRLAVCWSQVSVTAFTAASLTSPTDGRLTPDQGPEAEAGAAPTSLSRVSQSCWRQRHNSPKAVVGGSVKSAVCSLLLNFLLLLKLLSTDMAKLSEGAIEVRWIAAVWLRRQNTDKLKLKGGL